MRCAPWVELGDLTLWWPPNLDNDDDRAAIIDAASDVLYGLSAEQYGGVCTSTVRPCGTGVAGGSIPDWWWDTAGVDRWRAAGWPWSGLRACTGGDCSCAYRRLDLPGGPVVEIIEVVEDGVALDPTTYRLVGSRSLYRVEGSWRCTQPLHLPLDEPGTWGVTYRHGVAPPPAGVLAARALVTELAKARAGDKTCRLPARVVEAARQSVSVMIEPLAGLLAEGLTGIAEVDLFIRSANPTRAIRPGRVRSPDERTFVAERPLGS